MRSEVTRAFDLLRTGNPVQRDKALELLQNTVFSFSMTLCGHREDAEDTMQEVLLKAASHLGGFESPKALTTWLYTVAKNRCWMSRRRSKFAPRQQLSLEELMPDASELDHLEAIACGNASPEKLAITGQDLARVQEAILTVPPIHRLVLVLHDVEELSTEEIARILNLKEGTVRVRLHRGRLFLRKQLSQVKGLRGAVAVSGLADKRARALRKLPKSRHCRRIFANLSNYLDGVLDETLCGELERHMKGCKPCEAFLSSLRTSITQTRELPIKVPDPHIAAQNRAQLASQL